MHVRKDVSRSDKTRLKRREDEPKTTRRQQDDNADVVYLVCTAVERRSRPCRRYERLSPLRCKKKKNKKRLAFFIRLVDHGVAGQIRVRGCLPILHSPVLASRPTTLAGPAC